MSASDREEPHGGREDDRPLDVGVTMGRPTGHLSWASARPSARLHDHPRDFPKHLFRSPASPTSSRGASSSGERWGSPRRRSAFRGAGRALQPARGRGIQDVDRDAQGNIRVTEIDLGRKVKNEVQVRLEQAASRSPSSTRRSAANAVRSADPVRRRVRSRSGYAAVTYLVAGGSGALVTIQGGEFAPIPFADLLDADRRRAATARGRDDRELSGRARLHGAARSARLRGRGAASVARKGCRSRGGCVRAHFGRFAHPDKRRRGASSPTSPSRPRFGKSDGHDEGPHPGQNLSDLPPRPDSHAAVLCGLLVAQGGHHRGWPVCRVRGDPENQQNHLAAADFRSPCTPDRDDPNQFPFVHHVRLRADQSHCPAKAGHYVQSAVKRTGRSRCSQRMRH